MRVLLCLVVLATLIALNLPKSEAQASATSQPSATPAKSGDAQPEKPKEATKENKGDSGGESKPEGNNADDKDVKDIKAAAARVKAIKEALKEEDPDWALVLGIGSLVKGKETDYQNESNVIHSSNLGRATPQLLTGVSFRSNVPNIMRRYRVKAGECKGDAPCPVELWQRRPWSGFVSLKFAPGASQVLNGYVIGGSYALTHHLNALIGFALTPVNEPAPGFRTVAAQFVQAQQAQGQYLSFNPSAMLHNDQNAFDGFPVTDSNGKLIYQGNPLTVHYRGGVVFGVSIPVYFGSVFK